MTIEIKLKTNGRKNMKNKYQIRFEELEEQLIKVEDTKEVNTDNRLGNHTYVNDVLFNEWRVKTKNLIVNACGKDSEHYKEFIEAEETRSYDTNYKKLNRIKAIFHAAKEDYFGGYIVSLKSIVQAELFDDEIEQAKELFDKDYYIAAAVIAGVVLETRMRELCKENNITIGKLDKLNKMNDELAKNDIYNSLIHKQIVALAGIRNSAAHGKTDEFSRDQVDNMIKVIENLLAFNFNI
jgi:hypothetical protein